MPASLLGERQNKEGASSDPSLYVASARTHERIEFSPPRPSSACVCAREGMQKLFGNRPSYTERRRRRVLVRALISSNAALWCQ